MTIGQIPGVTQVDPSTRLGLLALERRLAALEAAGGGGGGGVTDHGLLTGLADDDHPQYYNSTRGDARYAQRANNLSDLANAATARSNLALGGAAILNVGTVAGTVAAGDDSRITGAAQKASNLSDLANVTTARSNLGLAALAVLATVGTGELTNNAVTNAKLATVATATFKGRTTAGVGNVEDLTGTQATALLDVFTPSLKGLAPSGGSGSTFLRGDGTWQTIAGGGDMLKANNLSDVLSVATARTNLGLSSLATLVPPGTTTTYLRGDATFQTLPLAPIISNGIVAAQVLGTADTYVTNSNIDLAGRAKAGTTVRWRFYVTKTAAGTATPILTVRLGTAGTTADTAVFAKTFLAQTAATDKAMIEVEMTIRVVGGAGVGGAVAMVRLSHTNTTTGVANAAQEQIDGGSATLVTNSSPLIAGISINAGASSAWTVSAGSVDAVNLT